MQLNVECIEHRIRYFDAGFVKLSHPLCLNG